jgi:hypothetical protein
MSEGMSVMPKVDILVPLTQPKLTTNAKSVRCKVDLCVNKAVRGGIPGLCRTHGGGKRCEAPLDPLKPIDEGGQKCGQSAKEGGFCIKHGGGKRCIMPNCHKGAKNGDFCISHSHISEDKKLDVMRDMGIRVVEGSGGLTKSVTRVAAELQDQKRAHVRSTKAAQALAQANEMAIRLERERVGAEGADDILIGIRKGSLGGTHRKSPSQDWKGGSAVGPEATRDANTGRRRANSGEYFNEQGGTNKRMKTATNAEGRNGSGHRKRRSAPIMPSGPSLWAVSPQTAPALVPASEPVVKPSGGSSTELNADETAHLLLSLTDSVVR